MKISGSRESLAVYSTIVQHVQRSPPNSIPLLPSAVPFRRDTSNSPLRHSLQVESAGHSAVHSWAIASGPGCRRLSSPMPYMQTSCSRLSRSRGPDNVLCVALNFWGLHTACGAVICTFLSPRTYLRVARVMYLSHCRSAGVH